MNSESVFSAKEFNIQAMCMVSYLYIEAFHSTSQALLLSNYHMQTFNANVALFLIRIRLSQGFKRVHALSQL